MWKVEEEKSSDVFGTEPENSSDFLSVKDADQDTEKHWTEVANVVFSVNQSRALDGLLWLLEGLYTVLVYILLVPVALLGYCFDQLRRVLRKVSDDVAFSKLL